MIALFHHVALLHHEDNIGVFDGGKTMRHDKARSAFHQFIERIGNAAFRAGIHRGRGFVENEHIGKGKHDARDAQKLLLPRRKVHFFGDVRIVAMRQARDETVRVAGFRRGDHFFVGSGFATDF